MMYGWDGWGWGGWSLMVLGMSALWVLVISGVIIAIHYVSEGDRRTTTRLRPNGPEDVLAQRFARGEIDSDEYLRCLSTIRDHRLT